jgi:hypothetical protein
MTLAAAAIFKIPTESPQPDQITGSTAALLRAAGLPAG